MKIYKKYITEEPTKMRDMTEDQAQLVALQRTIGGMAKDAVDAWLYGNNKLAKGIMRTLKKAINDMDKVMK